MAVSSASISASPAEEYRRRQHRREGESAHFERLHVRFGYGRLALVVAAVTMAWMCFAREAFSPLWLLMPASIFGVTARLHARVLRRQAHALRVAEYYRHGLARIEDRWVGLRERAKPLAAASSLYAEDLDIFGRGSLFELLCAARTRMGEEELARWLLTPAPVREIRERHAAFSELRDCLDLREEMATMGEDAGVGVHPEALLRWAEAQEQPDLRRVRWVVRCLALLAVGATAFLGHTGNPAPLLIVVLVEWILNRVLRRRVQQVFGGTERALEQMQLVSSLLARVERETFDSPRLRSVQGRLQSRERPASEVIARLATRVQFLESARSPVMKLLDVPLLYSVQVALAVQGWRAAHGPDVRGWIEALGEMEALLSVSGYCYEHPEDRFPEFADGPPSFEAQGLGHPLIPAAKCVRNDVQLGGEARVLVISGSNMSGKSTLMRAIGINTVLAMCGAPVRARELRLTPLRVGASILVNDSLQEGRSRFYAEITRLRAICDLAKESPPVLFLLDELLQGTNSKDRLAGAKGIVRALLEAGAIGLISTHDLALTALGDEGDGRLRNVHFQDRIEGGAMQFDFQLREGVVTRSNGLELMRLVGLDV